MSVLQLVVVWNLAIACFNMIVMLTIPHNSKFTDWYLGYGTFFWSAGFWLIWLGGIALIVLFGIVRRA